MNEGYAHDSNFEDGISRSRSNNHSFRIYTYELRLFAFMFYQVVSIRRV